MATAKPDRIKEIFKACDTTGDGAISRMVLRHMLVNESTGLSDEDLDLAIKSTWLKADAVGSLSEVVAYDDFVDSLFPPRATFDRRCEELFAKIDVDGNQFLDKRELVDLLRASGEQDASKAANWLMHFCDTDHNGKISLSEWKALFQGELSRRGDGMVDKTLKWFEEVTATSIEMRCEKLFCALDLNQSGGLDKSELYTLALDSGQPNARKATNWLMYQFDANNDGLVSLSEWKAVFAKEQSSKGAAVAGRTLCWLEEAMRARMS